MNSWSVERAGEVEAKLRRFIGAVSEVQNVKGCSFEGYKDFKVMFEYAGEYPYRSTPPGFFVALDPRLDCLCAWGGGIRDIFPQPLREFIDKAFPDAQYETTKPIPGLLDGFHRWRGIQEADLDVFIGKIQPVNTVIN